MADTQRLSLHDSVDRTQNTRVKLGFLLFRSLQKAQLSIIHRLLFCYLIISEAKVGKAVFIRCTCTHHTLLPPATPTEPLGWWGRHRVTSSSAFPTSAIINNLFSIFEMSAPVSGYDSIDQFQMKGVERAVAMVTAVN